MWYLFIKIKMGNRKNGENDFYIPTYVINLKDRIDRRNNILDQFKDKPEFDVTIIEAETHSIGAVGLWKSMIKILNTAIVNEDDIILICEDDHIFTPDYCKEYLFANIVEASKKGAEILSGGIGGFGIAVPVSSNLYWVDWYWCNQFIVIFRSFFEKMLAYSFKYTEKVDGALSHLSNKKMTMYPFVSIQKDFGYSDVTFLNNKVRGTITSHFMDSNARLSLIHKINYHYNYEERYQE